MGFEGNKKAQCPYCYEGEIVSYTKQMGFKCATCNRDVIIRDENYVEPEPPVEVIK